MCKDLFQNSCSHTSSLQTPEGGTLCGPNAERGVEGMSEAGELGELRLCRPVRAAGVGVFHEVLLPIYILVSLPLVPFSSSWGRAGAEAGTQARS